MTAINQYIRALRASDVPMDAVLKAYGRYFEVAGTRAHDRALTGTVREQRDYVVATRDEDMLLGFLKRCARRGYIEVPATAERADSEEPRASRRTARLGRPAKSARPTPHGKIQIVLEGRPDGIVSALGVTRAYDLDGETPIVRRSKFVMVGDENGVVLRGISEDTLPAATGFLRRRLTKSGKTALLRRAVIDTPRELSDEVIRRAHLIETSRGLVVEQP